MRKNDLLEIKKLDLKELKERILVIISDIEQLTLDKNMGKLKDLKVISKKRKDLSQLLTIKRQKELLGELESRIKKSEEPKTILVQEKT